MTLSSSVVAFLSAATPACTARARRWLGRSFASRSRAVPMVANTWSAARVALTVAAVAIVCSTADAYAVTLGWSQGGPNQTIPSSSSPACGNNNAGKGAMARDNGGNVVVTGCSNNGGNWDYLTIKYDGASGTELWRAVADGAAHADDFAAAMAVDASGDVVVTGYSTNASGNTDYLTIKYDGATGAE